MLDSQSDSELRKKARAALEAGKLPLPHEYVGRVRQNDWSFKYLGYCAVCAQTYPKNVLSWFLEDAPGKPEMHIPRCYDAWLAAARTVLLTMFEGEDFHAGSQQTGEGCLIWATLPPSRRVRFFLNYSILIDVLGYHSGFANEEALARCRQLRPLIEAACTHAMAVRPGEYVELQPQDF